MEFQLKGVCARKVSFELSEGKITNLAFHGGCSGNTKGIGSLVEGMDADTVIERLSGLRCGIRSTSCPDQLAKALKAALEEGK